MSIQFRPWMRNVGVLGATLATCAACSSPAALSDREKAAMNQCLKKPNMEFVTNPDGSSVCRNASGAPSVGGEEPQKLPKNLSQLAAYEGNCGRLLRLEPDSLDSTKTYDSLKPYGDRTLIRVDGKIPPVVKEPKDLQSLKVQEGYLQMPPNSKCVLFSIVEVPSDSSSAGPFKGDTQPYGLTLVDPEKITIVKEKKLTHPIPRNH